MALSFLVAWQCKKERHCRAPAYLARHRMNGLVNVNRKQAVSILNWRKVLKLAAFSLVGLATLLCAAAATGAATSSAATSSSESSSASSTSAALGTPKPTAPYQDNTLEAYGIPDTVIKAILENSLYSNGQSPAQKSQAPSTFTIADVEQLESISLATVGKSDLGTIESSPNADVATNALRQGTTATIKSTDPTSSTFYTNDSAYSSDAVLSNVGVTLKILNGQSTIQPGNDTASISWNIENAPPAIAKQGHRSAGGCALGFWRYAKNQTAIRPSHTMVESLFFAAFFMRSNQPIRPKL